MSRCKGVGNEGDRCFGRPLGEAVSCAGVGEGDSKMDQACEPGRYTGACDRCRCYSRWRYKTLPLGKTGPCRLSTLDWTGCYRWA